MNAPAPERDVLLASSADGILAEFNVAGVLGLADVHTARALSRIGCEADPAVLLAVALAVRALRLGSVCIDLRTQHTEVFDENADVPATGDVQALDWPDPSTWTDRVRLSPLVADGAAAAPGRPLRLVGGLLYLERYWSQQDLVRRELQERGGLRHDTDDRPADDLRSTLDRLFDGAGLSAGELDRQRLAAAVCALRSVTVLAGGPGTGKTTTVARLLALLRDAEPGLRVALAAPTGKAAARLGEAIRDAAARLRQADRERVRGLEAVTLHRLLGWLPGRTRFRHHAGNRLAYDVIVVDEMSMVSLTMMARLLEAVRPQARLILVGDPDQLSSVEAGAVLADITAAPVPADPALAAQLDALDLELPPDDPARRGVVDLRHTWRYGGAIGELAAAIRAGDPDAAEQVLRRGASDVELVEVDLALGVADPGALASLAATVRAATRETFDAAVAGQTAAALDGLNRHRLLCAHRRGPFGVARWSAEIERWVADLLQAGPASAPAGARSAGDRAYGEWYPGRPLLITANDYEQGLYNGDTGVVVLTPTGPRVVFPRGSGSVDFAPVRLDAVQTVHAMTVHRAQGSQFSAVSFVVPPVESPLLTRELLYTAVTRAERHVQVIGTMAAIRRAVERPANRASGLAEQLAVSPGRDQR